VNIVEKIPSHLKGAQASPELQTFDKLLALPAYCAKDPQLSENYDQSLTERFEQGIFETPPKTLSTPQDEPTQIQKLVAISATYAANCNLEDTSTVNRPSINQANLSNPLVNSQIDQQNSLQSKLANLKARPGVSNSPQIDQQNSLQSKLVDLKARSGMSSSAPTQRPPSPHHFGPSLS
jgi:hypothetical protein